MEKVHFNIDTNNIDIENRKLADKLLKESIIIDIINELNINTNTIYNNPYPFLQYYNSKKECTECNGLIYCKKTIKGMCDGLSEDNELYLKPCDYKKEYSEKYKYKKNIIINYMPDSFKDVSIKTSKIDRDDKEQVKVFSKIITWIKNPVYPGFYIYGSYGTGKTHILSCIVNDLAKLNYKTGYIYTIDFVIKMREKMLDNDSYLDEIEKIKNLDILAFDDMGAEKMSDWARDELFMPILNYRMENKLITLFSSNESLVSLKSKISKASNDEVAKERFMERIRTLTNQIVLDGKSKRIQN